MKKYFLKVFVGSFIFFGTGVLVMYLVSARSGLTASSGDKLTVDKWNEVVSNLFWKSSGSNVYYTGGNVGIGTDSPTTKLEVNGSIKANNIDHGCYPISYVANALQNFNISFNKTFSTIPNIILTLHSSQSGASFVLYTDAKSITGFSAKLKNTIGGSGHICWIAIGN